MNSRRDLFPPIEPYRTGRLRLDARHTMYWEESGNPQGPPVLCLHGGPGAGATAVHRRFFDPVYWRIVIFDQRGAGRSTPVGELQDNTPDHLVADIERFLYGARTVFPEAWRAFAGFLPEHEREDLLPAYYRRLTDPDPRIHMAAARAWSVYEGACSTLLPNPETVAAFGEDRLALGLARLEAHYFSRHLFSAERDLIARIDRIRDLPGVIVQGRYDMVCPIRSADELARAWPKAEYVIVPDAGHSAMEPGIREQLVLAGERHKRR